MKKSDIVVGESYAASSHREYRYNTYSSFNATGVTVLEAPVTKRAERYPYASKTVVKVQEIATGRIYDLPTREIRELWGPYAKEAAEYRRDRRNAANTRAQQQEERAKSLLNLIPAMRHAGIEDDRGLTYNSRVRDLLELHVPDIFVLNGEGGTTSYFMAPLADSISDYVETGARFKVSADVLMAAIR